MTKRTLIIIISIVFITIISGTLLLGCIPTTPTQPPKEDLVGKLKLSDYPGVFSKQAVIVIGTKASDIERESAQLITESLESTTGMKPQILRDGEITDTELQSYNLILIGTPESNELLDRVYDMTDAKRVTREYPGENKGILEILTNPWNKERALLLCTGSDELGVKAGSEVLENTEEIGKLSVETLTIGSKPPKEDRQWIIEGTRSSATEVSLNRKIVSPGEGLIITVKAWTFAPDQEVDYDAYFKLYRTDNPDKPLREKKVHIHSEKEEMYARADRFDWIITASEKKGTYVYRVVKKTNSEPSFDDYDMMQKVEFKIRVE